MTRVDWDETGKRYYEIGVDRGVLYVGVAAGVPWVGLKSVNETPKGGEPRAYYLDGLKYLNLSSAEEFEATINAYTSPAEFGPCDGTKSIHNGLFVTQQPRVQFGFSYRSLMGNEIAGQNLAYKIHLVYNALAAPTDRDNATLDDSADPADLSWKISTLPPSISGFKPTAHLVIDSRFTDPSVLSDFEDVLYGSESGSARLPDPDEVVTFFA